METINLTRKNFRDYLPLDIAAFSYAFPGAMGDRGGVVIVTTNAQVYYFNYVFDDFENGEVEEIIPIITQCDLPIFGETEQVPEGWRHISLGAGNNLLMQKLYVEQFFHLHKEYASSVDEIDGCLYRSWLKLMLKLLKA